MDMIPKSSSLPLMLQAPEKQLLRSKGPMGREGDEVGGVRAECEDMTQTTENATLWKGDGKYIWDPS